MLLISLYFQNSVSKISLRYEIYEVWYYQKWQITISKIRHKLDNSFSIEKSVSRIYYFLSFGSFLVKRNVKDTFECLKSCSTAIFDTNLRMWCYNIKNIIIQDLAEKVELIAMGYWTNLVNFVSDIVLHDEFNEVMKLKTMVEQLIK